MLRPPPNRARRQISPLRRKILKTVTAALFGVAGGLLYARYTVAPEHMDGQIPAMYGTMGAVVAILGLRLAAIFKSILSDYFGSRR